MRIGLRLARARRRWRQWLPLADTLAHYSRDDFSHDAIAGIVVGIVTIPQAIAYAYLAGLPPQAGLYACLLPMILYSIFGSSKHLVVGPVAIAALLVSSALAEFAPRYSDDYLAIAALLSLQVGIILMALRLFRLGNLANLLSHPVINGFVNAAAILVIISQLPGFTGLAGQAADTPLHSAWNVLANIGSASPIALLFSLAALALLLISRPLIGAGLNRLGVDNPRDHPLTRTGPLLVCVLSTLLVIALELDSSLAVVGTIPQGLPSLSWPNASLDLWIGLFPSAGIIAVITYVESYSVAATLASRRGARVRPNQELVALSAANWGAALTGAYPVAGSFSRSSVNFAAAARTQVSSLLCAAVIIICLLFFTQLFAGLPQAILAAIITHSILGLVDFTHWRHSWNFFPADAVTEWITFAGVLLLGVEAGLLGGVVLSFAFFIRDSSHPVITRVGQLQGSEHFRSAKRFQVTLHDQILALRIDENIYFANANQIEETLLTRAQRRSGIKHLLLVCSSVNKIDSTGLMMLFRVNQLLAQADISLSLSDLKGPLMQQVSATELSKNLGGKIYFTSDMAIKALTGEAAATNVAADQDTAQ